MSFKQIVFYMGCTVAWFILLPVFVIGGGIALLGYAVFAELGESIVGKTEKAVDSSTAREMAHRLCLGH
jgi:hypothetical protein